ncbi:hypothetical protein [Pacificibacter marinus]|uniref:DUF11 domain-containing protein n=1 Tax=Pacificibacter marinus TaxID=658057 RepID=A0A1Y5RFN9_9RHOB|nr:hypothetical protein [Pacificibacter marinus]SEK21119.1 conserved repeat domain-containing protein [Pacificibacter marinus]SLN16433.1 hypothetical protein PAM7971_00343 [Pacificibacter marinus]
MTYSFLKKLSPLVLGVVVCTGAPAFADGLGSTFSFLVVDTDAEGKEALVERASVKPGEVIHYVLSHENTTQDDMQGLIIAAPVPEGVTLTSGGQSSSVPSVFEVQAELDPELEGLEWSTLPAMRKVVSSDGTLREEALPEDEISAVRWTLSEALVAGETAQNTYRVRVN